MSLLQDIQCISLIDKRLDDLGFAYNHIDKSLHNKLKLEDNRYHYILSGFSTIITYKYNILDVTYPTGHREQFGVDDIVDLDLAISKVFDKMKEIAIELSNSNGNSYFDVIWERTRLQ